MLDDMFQDRLVEETTREFINRVPDSGFAYRGDQFRHAWPEKTNGLTRQDANYIVFVPDPDRKNSEWWRVLGELRAGVRWALTYADSWYGPSEPIRDETFTDFHDFFIKYPDRVPCLSLFLPSESKQFIRVKNSQSGWINTTWGWTIEHKVGTVRNNGPIPAANCLLILPTATEIQAVQTKVFSSQLSENAKRLISERGLSYYWRTSGRWFFHYQLGDLMTMKLIKEIH